MWFSSNRGRVVGKQRRVQNLVWIWVSSKVINLLQKLLLWVERTEEFCYSFFTYIRKLLFFPSASLLCYQPRPVQKNSQFWRTLSLGRTSVIWELHTLLWVQRSCWEFPDHSLCSFEHGCSKNDCWGSRISSKLHMWCTADDKRQSPQDACPNIHFWCWVWVLECKACSIQIFCIYCNWAWLLVWKTRANHCLRHRQLAERKKEGRIETRKEIGVLSCGAFPYCIHVSFPWQWGNLHTSIPLKSLCICKDITSVKELFFKLIICYFLFTLRMPKVWVRALQSDSPRLVLIRGWVMEQRVWHGSNWIPWCLDFNAVKSQT